LARKCGGCGQIGHNKRTCPALSETLGIREELIRPDDTDCIYELGQRITINYPWADNIVVGNIDTIDYAKANVFIHDEATCKNYGFNWRTHDEYKIRIELLKCGARIKRRRHKKARPNLEED